MYIVKITDSCQKQISNVLIKYITQERTHRVSKCKKQSLKNQLVVSEILAKTIIKRTFGIDIAKQKFAYSEYGKPYLSNYPNVHFNVSHSGDYVVCAVLNKPIGVDIQKIGEYNSDVAKRVCNKKELVQIENSSDKASEFTKLWTQKEAVLKMYGTGIACGDIKNCLDNHNVQSKRIEDYWISTSIKD